jgi:hypothetical protein
METLELILCLFNGKTAELRPSRWETKYQCGAEK